MITTLACMPFYLQLAARQRDAANGAVLGRIAVSGGDMPDHLFSLGFTLAIALAIIAAFNDYIPWPGISPSAAALRNGDAEPPRVHGSISFRDAA